jgi:hypothetical protein
MLKTTSRIALVLALAASLPAGAADLDSRPVVQAEPPPSRISGARPVYRNEGDVFFWRSYGWPGGQAGPCWRLWYGQWVWSC